MSAVLEGKQGGGRYISKGTVSIEDSTVSDNGSADGAGIFVNSGSTLNISGTTVIKDNWHISTAAAVSQITAL